MATLKAQQLLNQANQALAQNDLVTLCQLVERCQWYPKEYPADIAKHVLHCTRFLVTARYGKPRKPRIAGIYKNNQPIKLGRRQSW